MKYSALYFIPNPSAQTTTSEALTTALTKRLESAFPRATREDSPTWTLQHRLLRDVPPTPKPGDTTPANYPHAYQHFLRLSYVHASRAYCVVQPATEREGEKEGVITSIPAEEFESHYALVVTQWGQLWSPHRALDIPPAFAGSTYTLGGDFTLRIAELRARRSGPQSAASLSPGVVVVLTTTVGLPDAADGEEEDAMDLDEEIDLAAVQERLRSVWGMISRGVDFGKSEVREVMQGESRRGEEEEKEAVVRMWCEVLKLRG